MKQIATLLLCLLSIVVKIHPDACAADEHITENAEHIRHVAEDDKTEQRRKQHLRVVVDRDLLGGRTDIRFGDAELPDAGKRARQHQIQQLLCAHRFVGEQQKRQAEQAGERREPEDDAFAVLALHAEAAHKGVGNARTHAAEHARKRGKHRRVLKARLDDAYTAEKGDAHAADLHEVRFLTEQKNREQNCKEWRQLVEHVCVRKIQLPDGVEIEEQTDRAEERTSEQVGNVFLLRNRVYSVAHHHRDDEEQGDKVAEKRLLECGQIARQLDKQRHHREAECRRQNIENTLCFFADRCHECSLSSRRITDLLYMQISLQSSKKRAETGALY